MKNILLSFFLVVTGLSVSAQQHDHCGTTFADQLAYEHRLLANLAAAQDGFTENGVKYVPCFFHLVANSAGDGRGTETMVFNVMCTLNEAYLEHGIQFYLSPHPTLGWVDKTINNNNVYSNQNNALAMSVKRHPNAVNIYIVDFAFSGSGDPGVLAYYSPGQDWIVCEKPYTAFGDNTMPHEMGHFLSLAHTFFGWERDAQNENEPPCFESGDPGWPIAPVTSPGGVPTERQNGTNGTTAADKIADTPPDYNFGFCEPNNCPPYDNGAKDPLGTLVDPQENNFMGYYFGCSDFVFTEGQEAAMLADINSSSRNYLDNTFVPVATTFTTPSDLLVSPANTSVINTPSSVDLTWKTVEGATQYYVQIDIVPTFATDLMQSAWINDTTYTFTGLSPNKTYHWRVRPINQYFTCAANRTRQFKTAVSSTEDIAEVLGWSLQPNPVSEDATVTLAVTANNAFDAQVRIFDATGRTAWTSQPLNLFSGDNRVSLPTEALQNGIYFVALESGTNREVKRLVVVR
jgi:hypothetical protein